MSDTFYLKYRPQTIDELDSDSVRETLGKIVSSGKVPHAFLFYGPKGTGKTSAARILAKIVNCDPPSPRLRKGIEPCNKCYQCTSIIKGSNLDVVEMDAASHTGVDEVRVIRDAVKLAPAKAKNKVYIIDEAHMLSTGASNAFLKTLEEPPAHVYFILATTNPEKLSETIRSRTFNISFKKANTEEVVRSLARVVRREKIKADKETLTVIAKFADGSFRDGAKVLEQLVVEKRSLNPDKVREFLFQDKEIKVDYLVNLLYERDAKKALEEVERAVEKGVSLKRYLEEILGFLRSSLLAKEGIGEDKLTMLNKGEVVSLIEYFASASKDLAWAFIEQLPLELAIVRWCNLYPKPGESQDDNNQKNKDKDKKNLTRDKENTDQNTPNVKSAPAQVKDFSQEIWSKILASVKPINTTTEALLRATKPLNLDGGVLTIGVFYRFHKERLEEGIHRRLLEDVAASVLGSKVRIVCTLTEPERKPKPDKENVILTESDPVLTEGEDEDIIKVAKEIFGG